ncbi:LacI family DNA-binding transcriptional regulator [Paenibacillus barcinonensis]|uniref:LacI family DNA-binding transcriptional regulator n=1 Tax=Paenibacillus barcinonensis TaxID=198119 RepID=A0A2V4WUQ1_PAEBA|nr:LacI family DNA-binding transcriptional regulator [Paenibacillus barcinonensis]PYE52337.1 LacI family transcriptional regulator [Paenibacillus barcinonensis]QKS59545.1 LacI family DNA-binding transcriptional regulator [Paenibacillus barcinonensis]
MPKIDDVAKQAGVSVTTVSRVLNNRGYISEETREKVYRVMKELNYQPNEMARALFRRKSNMIGLIIPDVSHPFFSEMTYYLEYYADKSGYKLLLCNSNRDVRKESKYMDMLKKNKVDAIITGSSLLEVEHYLNLNLPIVSLDREVADNIPVVSSDNEMGGRLATQLLLDKKCKQPAFLYRGIGGPHHVALLANGRAQGYEEVMRSAGFDPIHLQLDASAKEEQEIQEEIIRFLEEHPGVDGIFASSDVIAAEALQASRHAGKRVPTEMKIIGYDDVKIASLLSPRLSSVRQPIQPMAERIIELVVKQINGEEISSTNLFPVQLVERETT